MVRAAALQCRTAHPACRPESTESAFAKNGSQLRRHSSCKIESIAVETNGRRVAAVSTQLGKRISSPWFIDASGSASSLFARAFQLPTYEAGPRKVAIWGYFPVTTPVEGTTLYADGVKPPYMEWVWEIPINPNTISVGYVATGETIKAGRAAGGNRGSYLERKAEPVPPL